MDNLTAQAIISHGWSFHISREEHSSITFSKSTKNNFPFSVSFRTDRFEPKDLVRLITAFIDSFNPDKCVEALAVQLGGVDKFLMKKAISDFNSIKEDFWILAFDLSTVLSSDINFGDLPHSNLPG